MPDERKKRRDEDRAFGARTRRAHILFEENIAPMVDLAMPGPFDEMLDVGCCLGYVGKIFAPYVKRVVGIDIEADAVERARKMAADTGLANLEFEVAGAEDLPFAEDSFDIVASRFAFHHFPEPRRVLGEIKRVSRSMSRIVVYDVISSADGAKADLHNEIEKARDPSHVRILQDREWRTLFRRAGLEARAKISVLIKRDMDVWLDVVDAPPDRREAVRKLMVEKAVPGNSAGIGARVRGEKVSFTHTCGIWLLVQA
ncbi:MAG: class I SAM-dependent methyltransferase [Planctomycetota bacterium]